MLPEALTVYVAEEPTWNYYELPLLIELAEALGL